MTSPGWDAWDVHGPSRSKQERPLNQEEVSEKILGAETETSWTPFVHQYPDFWPHGDLTRRIGDGLTPSLLIP